MIPSKPNKIRHYLVGGHASILNFINGRHVQLKCKQRMVKADREIVGKLLENIEADACAVCDQCEREGGK